MVEEKLQNADNLLKNAAGSKQQYGFALMAYHGAIEDFFRQEMAAEIAELEEGLNGRKSGWLDLIKLWEQKHILTYEDKKKILNQNSKRQVVSHGGYLEVTRAEAEAYGSFVKYFIEQNSASRRSYRVTPTPTPEPRPVRPTAVANPPVLSTSRSSCLRRLLIATIVIGLLIGGCYWSGLIFLNYLDTNTENGGTEAEVLPEKTVEVFDPTVEVEAAPTQTLESVPVDENKTTPSGAPTSSSANDSDHADTVPEIRVIGNSYVRSEPNADSEIIGTVLNAEVYKIIETSADGNWYKIELAEGQAGWLGSTRASRISP